MTTHRYIWTATDTLVSVAGSHMVAAGYTDIYAFIGDIYTQNPQIFDWYGPAIAAGTVILLPYRINL